MAFASNAVVFPGGQVAESDCDLDVSWIGPDASYWARRMNCDEVTARSLVVAAIREVFEETGVLFAGSDSQSVACELDSGSWADERKRLTRTDESFAAVLRRHDLALRADLLGLRSNWLTPESSPMRYDTFFFAAMLPDGQEPDANTSEAADGFWARPDQLIAAAEANEIQLMLPTLRHLQSLASAESAEQFVAEEPTIVQIKPTPRPKQ